MNAAPRTADVFYIDPATGWASALFDAEGNQLGEAVFSFKKYTAKWEAQRMAEGLPVFVYKKDGTLHHIIEGRGA